SISFSRCVALSLWEWPFICFAASLPARLDKLAAAQLNYPAAVEEILLSDLRQSVNLIRARSLFENRRHLMAKKILIITGDAGESYEALYAKHRMAEAGYTPVIAAPRKGPLTLV